MHINNYTDYTDDISSGFGARNVNMGQVAESWTIGQ